MENGDFSIQMLFRSVFDFFWKQPLQGIFSIQNGEISILNEDFSIHFFRSVLIFYWKTNSTNNFLHSKLEKPPFWMEISPFNFFQKCFYLKKKQTPLRLHSTNNFLHLEWRNLHSEWRFLHSNFFRSVSNLFFEIYLSFFSRAFSHIFSIQSFSEAFRTFFWNLFLFFFQSIFSIQNGEISI